MINNLHHFEILTQSSEKLIAYFVNGFKFSLISQQPTKCNRLTQHLIGSNSVHFLLTSPFSQSSQSSPSQPSAIQTSLLAIRDQDKALYDLILSKRNTVFNVAFKVADLDQVLFNCRKHQVKIIKNRHKCQDGKTECAIIRSCIDGVAHTLLDSNLAKSTDRSQSEFISLRKKFEQFIK